MILFIFTGFDSLWMKAIIKQTVEIVSSKYMFVDFPMRLPKHYYFEVMYRVVGFIDRWQIICQNLNSSNTGKWMNARKLSNLHFKFHHDYAFYRTLTFASKRRYRKKIMRIWLHIKKSNHLVITHFTFLWLESSLFSNITWHRYTLKIDITILLEVRLPGSYIF